MAEIDRAIERQRKKLKDLQDDATRDLVDAYKDIEARLDDDIEAVANDLIDDQPLGRTYRYQRHEVLIRQVQDEMRRYGEDVLVPTMSQARLKALHLAADDAEELMKISMGVDATDVADVVFTKLPTLAIEAIVGATRTGPLAELINSFGPAAGQRLRKTLTQAVALGWHPSKTSREIRKGLKVSASRATLIARTETLRAYRESSRQSYLNNQRVVKGWVWHASLSERTCAACWSLHGKVFKLETRMAAHPACRCTMVPLTKSWKELGATQPLKDTRYQPTSGALEFARQPAHVQKAVLGPTAYKAYKQGDLELEDVVQVKHSSKWGATYSVKKP